MADNQYFLIVTTLGKDLIEQAYSNGTKVNLVEMALGDSNGDYIEPDESMTGLVNEFGRESLHDTNTGDAFIQIITYVDSTYAGSIVREFGLYDDLGNMIAYGAYPASLIPNVDSGEYIQLEIEARIDLASAASVTATINPIYPLATEDQFGIVRLSNSYQGSSETTVVTEKALSDGLNAAPLILKRTRLYPDDLTMSLLPIGQSPRPEWILPASASKVKFINIQTRVVTSEPINLYFTIYCHDSESGGVTSPSSFTQIYFSVPNFTTQNGVYNNFIVPITLADGGTPKRLSFMTGNYGPSANVVSKFEVIIDAVWEGTK